MHSINMMSVDLMLGCIVVMLSAMQFCAVQCHHCHVVPCSTMQCKAVQFSAVVC